MTEQNQSIVTEQDKYRLQKLYEARRDDTEKSAYRRLLDKLEDSVIVYSEDVPDDVITLNARFTLRDAKGKVAEYKLVLPSKSDTKKRRLSVLSPLGVALLGQCRGAEVQIEDGAQFKIVDVLYQPEATPA
jgi:regulator of nucleoside diphosphate kinase